MQERDANGWSRSVVEGCFKGLPGGPLSGSLLSKVGPDLDLVSPQAGLGPPAPLLRATERWSPRSYLPGGQEGVLH